MLLEVVGEFIRAIPIGTELDKRLDCLVEWVSSIVRLTGYRGRTVASRVRARARSPHTAAERCTASLPVSACWPVSCGWARPWEPGESAGRAGLRFRRQNRTPVLYRRCRSPTAIPALSRLPD